MKASLPFRMSPLQENLATRLRTGRLRKFPYLVLCVSILFCIQVLIKFTSSSNVAFSPENDVYSSVQWRHRNLLNAEVNASYAPSNTSNQTDVTSGKVPKCFRAAIEQYPRPLMPQSIRKQGGIVLHFLVTLYTFLALAIVCDEYFVPSLEKISEALHLSTDVAGATFMAAGSSAPELAASVIGIFISKDDVGLGTVVGSAVFNITFVISVCGLFSGLVMTLSWWPLIRDTFFYLISLIILVACIADGFIEWYETVLMIGAYVLYILVMVYNESLHRWVENICCVSELDCTKGQSGENRHLINGYRSEITDKDLSANESDADDKVEMEMMPDGNIKEERRKSSTSGESPGLYQRTIDALSVPLNLVFYYSIPDCRKDYWEKWYMVTLLMAILWISAFSYILVWMITIIGSTFNISDVIMGLTFLAAGVSLPDAISSLAVAKIGLGDMAVSNAIGSNVFDILLCLGLPWFLKTSVISTGTSIPVYNKGLLYSTLSLFATVIFLVIATHCNGWKLDRKFGIMLMIWYVIFTVITTMYELNLFGNVSRPSCPTDY